MRLGHVIGRVVLSTRPEAFRGGRWLIASPLDAKDMLGGMPSEPSVSAQPSLVVYDDLGAGIGDVIGFVEGAEAMAPFDHPMPIDAISVAIFEIISYHPPA